MDEQIEGIEHYLTPATMGIIRNLILYFRAHPEMLKELAELSEQRMYPDHERLSQLRAWLLHHGP